jgi:hypothetical protein
VAHPNRDRPEGGRARRPRAHRRDGGRQVEEGGRFPPNHGPPLRAGSMELEMDWHGRGGPSRCGGRTGPAQGGQGKTDQGEGRV